MRVVATLTSVPGREDILLETCKSIANQTIKPDAIYLTIPTHYKRMNKTYGEIPEEIKKLCTVIRSKEDYGPITKIFGGIIMENDPETIIISCDDDVKYPPSTFEELLTKSKLHPDACICGSGMLVNRGLFMCSMYTNIDLFQPYNGLFGFIPPKDGRKVDLIFGTSGVLYKRKFFPSFQETLDKMFKIAFVDNSIFCNDDVLISSFMQLRKIERWTFPGFNTVKILKGKNPQVALSFNYVNSAIRMEKSIKILRNMGYLLNYEDMALNETFAGTLTIVIILVLIGIVFVIIMWYTINNTISSQKFNQILYLGDVA